MRLIIWDCAADNFLPYVGEMFTFQQSSDEQRDIGDSVELELVEVRHYGQRLGIGNVDSRPSTHERRESFSLLFVLRSSAPLGKGLHRLIHRAFEPCDLFLSRVVVPEPGQGDRGKIYYEAVFG